MRNIYDCILIAVLFVLSLVGGAWSQCVTSSSCPSGCSSILPGSCSDCPSRYEYDQNRIYNRCLVLAPGYVQCYYETLCSNTSSGDSLICVRGGNLWIDGSCCDEQCVCEKDGGEWVNGSCQNCNDHIPVPDKCMEVWKNGYTTDSEGNPGGGGYWAITTYECFYDSCAMSLNCTEKSSFPAGNLTCDDFLDTTSTHKCVAVVGHRCTIQCPNNTTKNCDCDGSCEHAKTLSACHCPELSSSSENSNSSSSENPNSSSSENPNSSSSENPNSSNDGPNSSPSPSSTTSNGDWEYDYSKVLNDIEWNTRQTVTNTNTAAGYLSSIDKWQSTINFNNQENANKIKASVDNAASEAANAANAVSKATDTLHSMHGTLNHIDSTLNTQTDLDFDISGWVDSAQSKVIELQNIDTSHLQLSVDSLKADTSNYKSKFSGLFIRNAYTRNGCYEFNYGKSGKIGHGEFDVSVDFGDIAGFDLCAIIRGVVRALGSILCLLITIKAYRSAFSSSDG